MPGTTFIADIALLVGLPGPSLVASEPYVPRLADVDDVLRVLQEPRARNNPPYVLSVLKSYVRNRRRPRLHDELLYLADQCPEFAPEFRAVLKHYRLPLPDFLTQSQSQSMQTNTSQGTRTITAGSRTISARVTSHAFALDGSSTLAAEEAAALARATRAWHRRSLPVQRITSPTADPPPPYATQDPDPTGTAVRALRLAAQSRLGLGDLAALAQTSGVDFVELAERSWTDLSLLADDDERARMHAERAERERERAERRERRALRAQSQHIGGSRSRRSDGRTRSVHNVASVPNMSSRSRMSATSPVPPVPPVPPLPAMPMPPVSHMPLTASAPASTSNTLPRSRRDLRVRSVHGLPSAPPSAFTMPTNLPSSLPSSLPSAPPIPSRTRRDGRALSLQMPVLNSFPDPPTTLPSLPLATPSTGGPRVHASGGREAARQAALQRLEQRSSRRASTLPRGLDLPAPVSSVPVTSAPASAAQTGAAPAARPALRERTSTTSLGALLARHFSRSRQNRAMPASRPPIPPMPAMPAMPMTVSVQSMPHRSVRPAPSLPELEPMSSFAFEMQRELGVDNDSMDLDMDMVDMQLDADADFDLDLNLDFEREFAADTKGWISDWQVLSFDASCRSSVMAVEG